MTKRGHLRAVEDEGEIADDRPVVGLPPGSLEHGRERAAALLADDAELYQREGEIVRVVRRDGLLVVHELGVQAVRARLSSLARWLVHDSRSGAMKPSDPPEAVVRACLEWGEWPGLRELIGVTETPMLRPDGTILDAPGFDAMTGLLFVPNADYLPVPEAPTKTDASSALAELIEVFCDFPHVSKGAKHVPVAAILTLFARHAIKGPVPAFVFDASQNRSGKSKQMNAIYLIATGSKMPPGPSPRNEEELEKVLGGLALKKARLIGWDNLPNGGTFGGAAIDRVLTAEDRVELRVLGSNAMPELRWRAVMLVSANNLQYAGDTSKRCIASRLETTLQNPEERTDFVHPDLYSWIEAERPRLVRAALTLLRAFWLAGRPRQEGIGTMGGFDRWAELVAHAIVWAGGANVLACRPAITGEDDPDARSLRAILATLALHDPTQRGMTTGGLVAALWPKGWRDEAPNWDGLQDARDTLVEACPPKAGAVPEVAAVGYLLRKLRGRVSAGQRVVSAAAHNNVTRWVAETVGG